MDSLIKNMMAFDKVNYRANLKFTVLHRPNGEWTPNEIHKLTHNLNTEVYFMRSKPEHLILMEHFTKAQALAAIDGGFAFTAKEVVGIDNVDMPWQPQVF